MSSSALRWTKATTCWWWARGAGLSTTLLGSTATTLAAHGRVPVLVAGGDAATTREPTARRGLYHIVTQRR